MSGSSIFKDEINTPPNRCNYLRDATRAFLWEPFSDDQLGVSLHRAEEICLGRIVVPASTGVFRNQNMSQKILTYLRSSLWSPRNV